MKNKKGARELSTSTITLIVILSCILVFSIVGTIKGWGFFLDEEEFNITKEECHDERRIYFDLSDFEKIEELNNDFNKYCKIYEKYNISIKKDSLESNLCGKILWEKERLRKEFNDRKAKYFEENGRYETVCEEVEVDEILIENASNKLKINCWEMGDNCLFGNENDILILNNGLTKKWLAENCEIQPGECLKWGRMNKDRMAICKDVLGKAKCIFDKTYFVQFEM